MVKRGWWREFFHHGLPLSLISGKKMIGKWLVGGGRTSFSGTLPLESNFLQFKLQKNKEASLISA